jgi:hypothetical protein
VHVLLCRLQTNCDIMLPEFEVQTIIGNSFLKFNGEDANAMAKRVAACDNADLRPVRVSGIRRAWNAPGVRAKTLQVRQLLLCKTAAAACVACRTAAARTCVGVFGYLTMRSAGATPC